MRDRGASGITAELTRHFFRRFFENDVLESDGETTTTMARALAIAAAPGLMFAFFLQNSYPQRSAWGRIEDQYFFVLFSFVVMAGVALFELERLFSERLDFLVLTPLPLQPGQLLRAKAAALACLLGFFLLAANLLGGLLLPAVSKGVFWRLVWAQTVAVGLAGLFGAVAVMAVGGLLLCILPAGLFRKVTPLVQMLATAALALLVLQYARFGDDIALVLEQPGAVARWVPTVWFLGVFERLLHGDAAEKFAAAAAQRAWAATGVAVGLAVLFYPLAWVRMRRMAVQGDATRSRAPVRWWSLLQNRMGLKPTERAVFSFIGKTIVRNSRHQVYLAIYGGVGLALSAACALGFRQDGRGLRVVMSALGMRAVLPLLLFWTMAGLRMAFAFPQNLPARWVFRVTGVDAGGCARATRLWSGACGTLWVAGMVITLGALGWGWRALLVQAVCGICLCVALAETFFMTQRGAPFTRPRSPGKSSLPAMLTLYLGVLPPLLFGIAWAEVRIERSLAELLCPVLLVVLLRMAIEWAREQLMWTGEETEGAEGEFQLLGLAGELRA